MESIRVQTGEQDRIYIQAVNSSSAGVTGATILLSIRRDSDGTYWTGTGYSTTYTTLTMSETDSANLPGIYHYDFTPDGPSASFLVRATTATAAVVNDPWVGQIKVGDWVDNVDTALSDLATSAQAATLLTRIGPISVDLEFRRLGGLIDKILKKMP